MVCCIAELCSKDVIDIESGNRIGYVADVDVDSCSGHVVALCVKTDGFFSLKPPPPIRIQWCDIAVIGQETVLVKNVPQTACPQKKKGLLSLFGR